MYVFILMIGLTLGTSGCLTPNTNDQRGINSSMMAAYQASNTEEKPVPITFPLSPQSQAYALTGGVLALMVLLILKSSQTKEK